MKRLNLLNLLFLSIFSAYCQIDDRYKGLDDRALENRIQVHIENGEYLDAMPLAEALLDRSQINENDSLKAIGLFYVANLHWYLGSYDRALPLALEAKEIRYKMLGPAHPDYAKSLSLLALINGSMGKYKEALSLFLEATDIYETSLGMDHPDYGPLLNNLAFLYENMGQFQKALPLYIQAIEVEKRILGTEHPEYAMTLNNLALLYEKLGDYYKSLPIYLEAKKIREQTLGRDHPEYGESLHNLGSLYKKIGNYGQALPLYLEAKDVFEKALGKEHPYYAASLNNIAVLYERMGDYSQALALQNETKEIDERVLGKDHPYYATTLNNLAILHYHLGEYSRALPLFVQASVIERKVLGEMHTSYATSLNNQAAVHEALGNYRRALPLYVEAIDIRREVVGERHVALIQSLNNLAHLYHLMGDFDKGWDVLRQALSLSAGRTAPETIDQHWYDQLVSASYPSTGHLQEVIKSLSVAYDILGIGPDMVDAKARQAIVADLANTLLIKARNQVSGEDDKLRLLAQSHEWLQKSLRVLDPVRQTDKAFHLAEQNKSVLLLQATKSEMAYRLGEIPDSLVWQERNLLEDQSQLQVNLLENTKGSEQDSLISQLNDINQSIDQFVRMIERDYPKYHQIKYQMTDAQVNEIQPLLDRNTALLEYVVGDSVVHIFYVDQQQVQWYQLAVPNGELQDRIESMHHSLNDYSSRNAYKEYTRQANWFYESLIAPAITDKEGITHLMVVPDGELGHLPFETFLVEELSEEEGPHYLLDDYSISYSYSSTVWKENLEAQDPQNNGQMLAVAADYGVALDSTLLAMRLPTDQWRRGELTELPAARKEVESLQEKYAGFFAFDKVASERTVKAMAPEYSILHFATHGFLDEERPVLSSLAFTEDSDSTESNFWQAHEISKTQLNADLVVLSACETGYGKFETGNGVASLARAFMYAGAPALVVSLWQVHDESTSELMTRFYDHLDSGMKKDEALRQAKLDFIQSAEGIQKHPAFWSPFIMMGKTDAINIKKKGEVNAWVIGFGLLAVLLIGGVVLRRRMG